MQQFDNAKQVKHCIANTELEVELALAVGIGKVPKLGASYTRFSLVSSLQVPSLPSRFCPPQPLLHQHTRI